MIFLDERDTPALLTRCNEIIQNKNFFKGLLRNKNCVCRVFILFIFTGDSVSLLSNTDSAEGEQLLRINKLIE